MFARKQGVDARHAPGMTIESLAQANWKML